MTDPARRRAALLLVTLGALALRAALAATTMDVPGDGPMRAYAAYQWARAPRWISAGFWPPGLLYLAGTVTAAGVAPLFASRAVNVVMGTLTIPVFKLLLDRVFDPATGWFGALLLAALPLHLELSATSLAEASLVFAVVAGLLGIVTGLEGNDDDAPSGATRSRRAVAFALGVVAIAWATMTRYEAWPLALVIVGWVAACARPPAALAAAVVLLAFPALWTVGNAIATGDPWLGFTMAARGATFDGAGPVGPPAAITLLGARATAQLGDGIVLAVVAGILATAVAGLVSSRQRLAYLAVTAVCWIGLGYSAMARGQTLYGRYLLLGLVLALPFAFVPFARLAARRRGALAVVVLLGLVSIASGRVHEPMRYVTRADPAEIRALAAWLRARPDGHETFLMTDLGWKASYLPLYEPELGPRGVIISAWVTDDDVAGTLQWLHPTLLVTANGDDAQRRRVEDALGSPLPAAALVHRIGTIAIYDVASLLRPPPPPEPGASSRGASRSTDGER